MGMLYNIFAAFHQPSNFKEFALIRVARSKRDDRSKNYLLHAMHLQILFVVVIHGFLKPLWQFCLDKTWIRNSFRVPKKLLIAIQLYFNQPGPFQCMDLVKNFGAWRFWRKNIGYIGFKRSKYNHYKRICRRTA